MHHKSFKLVLVVAAAVALAVVANGGAAGGSWSGQGEGEHSDTRSLLQERDEVSVKPAEVMSISHESDPLHKQLGNNPDYNAGGNHGNDGDDGMLEATTTMVPLSSPSSTTSHPSHASQPKKLFCRYDNQAALRPDKGRLLVTDLDPNLCTHIIYGSLGLVNGQIQSLVPEVDYKTDPDGIDSLQKLADLKRGTQLKTILSVGGPRVESASFSSLAASAKQRQNFVHNVTWFLRKYDFDGLELDWVFPGSSHGSKDDKQNFVILVEELKRALSPHGFWLAAQVGAHKSLIEAGYQVDELSRHLDSIHLMAYDYQETRQPVTTLLAPLYDTQRPAMKATEPTGANVDWSVTRWLELGAPAEKLMLGVTYYGQTYQLDRASVNGLNAGAADPAPSGPWSGLAGFQLYGEFCEELVRRPSGWTVVRDHGHLVPYAFRGRLWIAYEDRESLAAKAEYALQKSLGGMVVQSLDADDHLGQCHSHLKFPLTKTVRSELGLDSGRMDRQLGTHSAWHLSASSSQADDAAAAAATKGRRPHSERGNHIFGKRSKH